MDIQSEIVDRIPRIQERHLAMYRSILESNHAPRWNAQCGDRLLEADIPVLDGFCETLSQPPGPTHDWLESYVQSQSLYSPYFQRYQQRGISGIWMSREDIRDRLHEIVPLNADLGRLVLNPTSGTTGMPVQVPNTPLGVGHYQPLILEAIRRHGIHLKPGLNDMAAVQICSQSETMTYATVHSYYDGAGFAKINISPAGERNLLKEWNDSDHPEKFIQELRPAILTGDPFAFETYMDYQIDYRPSAVVSTASSLSPDLRSRMESFFRCPIVDFYSSNETGPIACSCPEHPDRYHQLAPDIFLELLCGSEIVASGEGRLLVSGGRNPLLPLLRYNTGDYCSIVSELCSCGQKGYIQGLQGRPSVFFHSLTEKRINPLDFARVLRFVPSRRHRIQQNKDLSMDIFVDPGSFALETYVEQIQSRSIEILEGASVRVHSWDPALEDAYPYEVLR
ncbi:MAG TPA: hypothetical protein DEA96_06225 [Leptospiraceae bacterium]|nr:hypothetical protein [Spirochaetaceae bacterium]HBS04540.1 hypothetical protein [Leptospiraceae bacterium]|tara:strand:+ start:19188 stop:20540 length:1353 start_codon:yes stop_codon:yes gene_type:complete